MSSFAGEKNFSNWLDNKLLVDTPRKYLKPEMRRSLTKFKEESSVKGFFFNPTYRETSIFKRAINEV